MKRNSREDEERVELVGVPHYAQGEADGLCVYYAMSMMLAALFPERTSTIHGTSSRRYKDSPVFQGLRSLYPTEKRFKEKIAEWFFGGMAITEAAKVLNQFAQQREPSHGRHFNRWPARARRVARLKYARGKKALAETWSVSEVMYAIQMHLPVLVAGGGLGDHAVLAIGYSTCGRSERMLYVLDPGSVRPMWQPSGALFVDDAEIIVPNLLMFQEYRPAMAITRNGVPHFKQWSPNLRK